MEFSDIFFTIIVPILTLVTGAAGANFLARGRAAWALKKQADAHKDLETQIGEAQEHEQSLSNLLKRRAQILQRWQERFLDPLDRIKHRLSLGVTIGFEPFKATLSDNDKATLNEILEELQQLSEAEVDVLPAILNDAGMILFAIGEQDRGEEFLQRAVERESLNQDARANLGTAKLMNGKPGEAAAEFLSLIEIARHRFDAYFGLGLAKTTMNHLDEAVSAYSAAIRLRPEHAPTYCELGRAQLKAGDIDRAIESVKVAIKLKPELVAPHSLYMALLLKNGMFEDTLRAGKYALEHIDHGEIHYYLACACALQQQKEPALQHLRDAIRMEDGLRFRARDDASFQHLHDSRRFRDLLAGKPGLF